jgi:sulfotransferase
MYRLLRLTLSGRPPIGKQEPLIGRGSAVQKGIHFISGLPRSGSTLLAGILRQNQNFHAGMTSPVGALFNQLLGAMGATSEHAVFLDEEQREGVLRGLFDGYYRNIHTEQMVFDTNRLWCSRMPAIAKLYPDSKVIACVRDPVMVLDSFERLVRKNPLLVSRMFPGDANATVFTRVDHLSGKLGTVGFAWNALQEAYSGEQADKLILVDYEQLTREPKRTLNRLYEQLKLPRFEHDFDNVSYEEGGEFDVRLGIPGLHTLAQKVRYTERKTILPGELVRRFADQCFWRDKNANPSKAIVLAPLNQARAA